jgi:hypothetical protein
MTTKTINEVYSQLAAVINNAYSKSGTKSLVKTDVGILVFGEYLIARIKDGYRIYTKNTFTEVEFSNVKNAFAWVIFDRAGRFKVCQRMVDLDAKISSLSVEIDIHKKSSTKSDTGKYVILLNKIQDESMRKQELTMELDNYLETAKRLSSTMLELS